MRSAKTLIQHELIGLPAEVAAASAAGFVGIKGVVADETRQLLTIETKRGPKHVPKDCCIFRFKLVEGWVRVDGRLLVGRPEDRVKKRFGRW